VTHYSDLYFSVIWPLGNLSQYERKRREMKAWFFPCLFYTNQLVSVIFSLAMFLTHSTLPDTCNKLLNILFDLEPFGLQAGFPPIGLFVAQWAVTWSQNVLNFWPLPTWGIPLDHVSTVQTPQNRSNMPDCKWTTLTYLSHFLNQRFTHVPTLASKTDKIFCYITVNQK
jgi:hypothetical protein